MNEDAKTKLVEAKAKLTQNQLDEKLKVAEWAKSHKFPAPNELFKIKPDSKNADKFEAINDGIKQLSKINRKFANEERKQRTTMEDINNDISKSGEQNKLAISFYTAKEKYDTLIDNDLPMLQSYLESAALFLQAVTKIPFSRSDIDLHK